ncbi:MAG: DUF6491 family protein [Alphaproteobacteria bacterium]
MTRYFLAALLACAALPALAQTEPAPVPTGRPCLRQGQIYDYQYAPGGRALIVTDQSRVRYRLTFISKCYDIDKEFGLRLKTRGVGGLSCVARGDSVQLKNAGNPRECIIRDVDFQTPFMDRSDLAAMGTGRLR